MLQAKMQSGVT